MAAASGDLAPIKLNSETIVWLLEGNNGVAQSLFAEAQKVLAQARVLAPKDSGEYAASLHIDEARTGDIGRLVYHVIASSPHAALVEFREGTLTRALGASAGKRGRVGLKKVKG